MREHNDGKLAVLGGRRAFDKELHVGRPNQGDRRRFLERVEESLNRNWLTNGGPLVAEFEQRIAELTGTRHCVATCNGTTALEIAIRALDLQCEVIVPSFTFIATAHALQWQGITPVFCDIDPKTHCIDPLRVERMITPRTSGVIGVHLWGRGADVGALERIAREHGLKLLFDASHALGCTYRGHPIGRFGNAEVFSFHATKVVNSLEGGAIVTNSDELAAKLRLMRNFGFTGYDCVEHLGINGKMNEISAAMGLTSLESMPNFVAHNRENYLQYSDRLSQIPGLRLIEYDESERPNYHYIVIEVDESVTGLHRDDFIAVLRAENVLARRYFYPGCHRMEPYKSRFPNAGMLLPWTEELAERVLVVPNGIAMKSAAVRLVCTILQAAIDNASEIRQCVRHREAA